MILSHNSENKAKHRRDNNLKINWWTKWIKIWLMNYRKKSFCEWDNFQDKEKRMKDLYLNIDL
jgi:hypothetical protein